MKKIIGVTLIAFALLYLVNTIQGGTDYANREIHAIFSPDELPISSDSFITVDKNVGCISKFNRDKKRTIFINNYENHVFKWNGIVINSTSNSVELDLNNNGKVNIEIDLETDEGFDLEQNQQVKVSFVLVSKPHCGNGLNISSASLLIVAYAST